MRRGRFEMTFSKWLFDKGIVYIIAFTMFYLIGSFFGIIPQPVKDFVGWFDRNSAYLIFAACFLMACFTVIKLKARKKVEA